MSLLSRLLKWLHGMQSSSRFETSATLMLESLEARDVPASILPEEQLFVYLLNRARHNPQAYQREVQLPVSLAGVEARQPLALNDKLFNSADFKSREMSANGYVGHQSPITGVWSNRLVRLHGYPLPSFYPDNDNWVESLLSSYGNYGTNPPPIGKTAGESLKALIVDKGLNPPYHRIHLLGMDQLGPTEKEIGVGHSRLLVPGAPAMYHEDYWTIHTGQTATDYWATPNVFLTGVAFDDRNGNRRYDLNEGLAGVTIRTGSLSTTTNAAGGWSIRVAAGNHSVVASGSGYARVSRMAVAVAGLNVEVDFISGQADAQVNFTDNASPVLGNLPALTPMNEDTRNAGDLVSRLTAAITDADRGALKGIAVTAAAGKGSWQYFNGVSWLGMGVPSEASARLLPSTYRVRFVPFANWNGQATITVRGWDRTTGVSGSLANLAVAGAVGGRSAFSRSTSTVFLQVRPVNDAPFQPGVALVLAAQLRSNSQPEPIAASLLLSGASDREQLAPGVALVGASGAGRWEFSRDNGQTWLFLGSPSRAAARLLEATDFLRFIPNPTGRGSAGLSFVVWDKSNGTAGSSMGLPIALGGATPFSVTVRAATLPLA